MPQQSSSTPRLRRRNRLIACGLGVLVAASSVGVATMPAWAGLPTPPDHRVEAPPAPHLEAPLASP